MCDYLKINRSSYYKWLNTRNKVKNYELSRHSLIELVQEHHQKHPSYGYRRINSVIRRETGWYISDNYVHKCCKYLEISSKVRVKKHYNKGEENLIYPNIINNNWSAKRPLELVASDTTILNHKSGKYDLTFYLDAFNNEIISYDLATSKNGSNFNSHINALKKLLVKKEERGYKDLETTLHTDQGSIYSSAAFANAHKDYTIKRSMSRIATPTDNPKIEALNGWIKRELACDFSYYNSQNPHEALEEYINYFNNEKPSSILKNKAPIQFRIESGFS